MRRILSVAAAAGCLVLVSAAGAWAFGVKDVIAMSEYGIPDSLIVVKIQHSETKFELDAKDLHALKEAGVSNDVVAAMLRTEDADNGGVYYGHPYYPYYGPYVSPWYVGLDLGFYAPYGRAYAPYYVGRGYRYRGFGGFRGGFAYGRRR